MLSVLCVTQAEPHSLPFLQAFSELAKVCKGEFVLAADGRAAVETLLDAPFPANVFLVESAGYLESVLDRAVAFCRGDYVLRLDDDELPHASMVGWLADEAYRIESNWKFARAHLWDDSETALMNAPLWPDHQTRLSLKPLAGGRRHIHAGSPFGGGALAPVLIEHHKFLVKPRAMRQAIADTYDRAMPGAGTGGFLPFNLPEAVYGPDDLELRPLAYAVTAAAHDAVSGLHAGLR